MAFEDVPIRLNGQQVLYSWFNTLRTAGLESPGWKKYTFSYSDLGISATSNDIEIRTLGALEVIQGVIIKHNTEFTGGGATAYEVSVGIVGNLEKYAAKFDVFQTVGDAVKEVTNIIDFESFVSDVSLRIAAESVGANLNNITQGSVDVYLLISKLPA